MGLDAKFLHVVGAALALGNASPAAANSPPKLAPELTRSGADLIQKTGFEATDQDNEINQLRSIAEGDLKEFRRAMDRGLSPSERIEHETRMFNSSRAYGSALRKFKTDRGFPYPPHYSTEEVQRFEDAIKDGTLTPTDKQKLFEEFMRELRANTTAPKDTDATIKGQFCGEYPDLCPPIN